MKSVRVFEIIKYLEEKKYCYFNDLMSHFQISQATAHRDIAEMLAKGLVRKIKGGIALIEPENSLANLSSPYDERIKFNKEAKQIIAQRALKSIKSGDILFLDSSTTTFFLAQELFESKFSSLTIITNSVLICQNFHKYPKHYALISIGGTYDLQLNSFLGNMALNIINNMNISKAFISAFGASNNMVSTNHEHHAEFLRAVLKNIPQKYLLCDSIKFGRAGIFNIATKDSFSEIISEC